MTEPKTDHTDRPPLLIIAGPTGVGKSDFAMKFAQLDGIKGELVTVDSVQIYKGLNIGSAKPTKEEQALVPHHLIDIADPNDDFNAQEFTLRARTIIDKIRERGATPIVVGGTNLYIRALTQGLVPTPPGSEEIRAKHSEIRDIFGVEMLHKKLQEVDPLSAARLHPNDYVRVSRSLEIYELTGRSQSELNDEHRSSPPYYNATIIAFTRPREELYDRINMRVNEMIGNGLYQEWLKLVQNGADPDGPALSALGYRHMKFLHNAKTNKERLNVIDQMKRDTRHFAKQQLSWLRNDPRTIWFQLPEDFDAAVELGKKVYFPSL